MTTRAESSPQHAAERRRMVDSQLRGRGIRHPAVLEVMGRLPREAFLSPEGRRYSYDDGPQCIGHGATISQPYIVALMTEALAPGPEARVLEIGTGSGYQTAILAEMASEVFTIELEEDLARSAAERLEGMGIRNVTFRTGDGRRGWADAAPFDGILLTAAPERVPDHLLEQLTPDGRLVAPVGVEEQQLELWERTGGRLSRRALTYVRFLPLLGGEG